jgi:hypothetical protein
MRVYRALAEEQERAEPTKPHPLHDLTRLLAGDLARGAKRSVHRPTLVAVVGQPAERLPALEAAVDKLDALQAELRISLLADINDQARALAILASWDAWQHELARRRAKVASVGASTTLPGQTGTLEDGLNARRARDAMLDAERAKATDQLLLTQARALIQRTTPEITP